MAGMAGVCSVVISTKIAQKCTNAAGFMGVDTQDVGKQEVGEVLAQRIIELMRATHMPNGITELGFTQDDVKALSASSIRQKRAIANAPRVADLGDMESIYTSALKYW